MAQLSIEIRIDSSQKSYFMKYSFSKVIFHENCCVAFSTTRAMRCIKRVLDINHGIESTYLQRNMHIVALDGQL